MAERAPQRIRLRRTRGWRKPADAVNCARPGKWGNPYRIDDYRESYPDATDGELRALAVSDFRGLIEGRWDDLDPPPYPSLEEIRAELAGRDLCCHCPYEHPCHVDVLLGVANS